MFVQLIRAKAADPAGIKETGDKWDAELRSKAIGFLGVTTGITTGGELVTLARFKDAASAKANSELPEQTAFFARMRSFIDGEPSFQETEDTATYLGGGSDKAGFVQVMLGTVHDRKGMDEMYASSDDTLRKYRPDLLGGQIAFLPGDRFIEAAYFTSEAEARAAEKQDYPAEVADLFQRMSKLYTIDEYLDIPEPNMR